MIKTTYCPICGKPHYVNVDPVGYQAWVDGTPIQYALFDLTADERELLLTGIDPQCWDSLFGSDEDLEPEEDWEEDEEDFDSDIEDGFNPYMGCYDFDC